MPAGQTLSCHPHSPPSVQTAPVSRSIHRKVGSCAQLGFSLANVARGSSPASELFGHKRLHLPLKRKAAPALAWPRGLHPCWPLPTKRHARMSVCAGVTPLKGGERPSSTGPPVKLQCPTFPQQGVQVTDSVGWGLRITRCCMCACIQAERLF